MAEQIDIADVTKPDRLKVVWDAIDSQKADGLLTAKAKALMYGYERKWSMVEWVTLSTEEVFHLPLINPETGAASRTFTQSGKYDGRAKYQQKRFLIEHKTSSEEIADPNAVYWRRLAIDSQVSSYTLANWQNGEKLDGALYDVIKKPTIRPKAIPKKEQAEIQATGTYFGFQVQESSKLATEEDADLYCLRLMRDTIEDPEKYFQRRVIYRVDNEILEYAQEAWDVAQSMLEARRKDAHYRNSNACVQYNSPCEFLGICSGIESADSDKWKRAEYVHGELPVLGELGGRDVLTNTRMKTFQTCRRKHYYRYELGLRREDEEEREALVFGSLIHVGLEAWWNCFKEQDNGSSDNGPAHSVNGIDRATQTELAF